MKESVITIFGALLVLAAVPWLVWGFKKARRRWTNSSSKAWMLFGTILEEVFIYPTEFFTHTVGPLVLLGTGLVMIFASS